MARLFSPSLSAYALWLQQGNTGSVQDFLDSNAGRELGYAEITASVASIGAEQDITGLTTTVTVRTRPILVKVQSNVTQQTATGVPTLYIYEGATKLYQAQVGLTSGNFGFISAQVRLAPSAGSHTYKVRAQGQVAGTCTVSAATPYPAFIQVVEC